MSCAGGKPEERPAPTREGLGGVVQPLSRRGPAPNRKGLGGHFLVEITAKALGLSFIPLGGGAEVPAGMVPVARLYLGSAHAFSAAREARTASGSAVAVVEPSAKTLGFTGLGFRGVGGSGCRAQTV